MMWVFWGKRLGVWWKVGVEDEGYGGGEVEGRGEGWLRGVSVPEEARFVGWG